jgi:hypothetical protein
MENNTEQVAHFVCKHFKLGMTTVEHCLESFKKCQGKVGGFNIVKNVGTLN